ncbi:adenosine kinase [Methylocella sp. CPCC 101449]|uniref:adenosine kinase n=1 Tax=Methylocella sp. CPCC 101449 TaxID=2987531 RepID=UPI002891A7A3|nr:adenosine kinase [Methylocella sp. CPCC 101449]MDT2020430.1 adenosine kinase [Methylocella sp. CPCC 101449]
MTSQYDVLGLGNAIVDVISMVDDDLLAREKLAKGGMMLIDEARTESLYKQMGSTSIISGGSAANTIVGAASFGAKTAFIGKVKADETGKAFAHDIRAIGVEFTTKPAQDGPATARCLILVTPDGERTMNTFLGACQNLGPDDVDADLVRASAITYLEGYLWDPPAAKQAFVRASEIAHAAGRRVALTLSDQFCVDRYRAEFLDLIRSKTIDILFANQHELKSLYETSDFDSAVAALRNEDILGAVTVSEKGSLVVTRGETLAVPAYPIQKLVDTTGAGDLYAAGFLAGLSRDQDLKTCAQLGALAASEVIQHVGARPQRSLAAMASENGLGV